ncbi:MAG: hypothetical protein WD885_00155 [Candidatus Saccharimonadales bacterium]
MAKDSKKVDDIMADMQAVDANDPDMIAKLNEIALKVAEAQGKAPAASKPGNLNVENDPMDELGCEGCQ